MVDAAGNQQQNNQQNNEPVKSAVELYDAADVAFEALQADPENAELKTTYETTKKTAKEKAAAELKERTESAEKNKPPAKYDLKLPENSVMSQSQLEKVTQIAKERGLSNKAAQELVNERNSAIAEYQTETESHVEKMQEDWIATAEKDKEYGGEKFKQNAELAKRVLAKFGTPEFNKILEDPKQGGFGNHPELLRVFVRIGKAMDDDQLIIPGAQGGGREDKPIEDRFYDKVDGGNAQK